MTKTNDTRPPKAGPSRPMIVSIVAGVIVFVILAAAGVAMSQSTSTEWVARSSALVLPSKPVSSEQLPGYYETLSRGQMVTTLAELVRLGEFQTETADQLGLANSQREFVNVTVNVVANTAMLQVVATSEDPNLAVAMVDGVVTAATSYIGDLVLPYSLVPVSTGENNLTETGLSSAMVIGVFLLVALVAGIAVQQAIFQLTKWSRHRHSTRVNRSAVEADGNATATPDNAKDRGSRSAAEAPSMIDR